MQQQQPVSDFTNSNTSFNLTKLWIEKSEDIELSATATTLMTALLWHYNPNKKYVFPHQQTLAKRIKRSLATVKRALSELKQAGFIISMRTRNGNIYAFTNKFFELLKVKPCTVSKANNEPCMYHEHVKEHKKEQTSEAVVSFKKDLKGVEEQTSKGTSSTTSLICSNTQFNLKEPPQILKDKAERGEIRNLHAYWASLREPLKIEYWEKQKEADREQAKKEAYKKYLAEQEQIREREAKEAEAFRNKPLNEQFSRDTALSMVRLATRGGRSLKPRSLTAQLVELYKIDIKSMV